MLKALLGGVGAATGGLIDAFSNIGYNKRAKELAKYQYDLNMQAWREQTEYNKPINQIARLREAGLNPQLAYGTGTQAGNASPTPQFQAPQLQRIQGFGSAASSGIDAAINLYQTKLNAEKNKSELELLQSQAEYNRELKNKAAAEAMLTLSKSTGQGYSNELLQFQRDVQRQRFDMEVDSFNRDMELKDAELQLKGSQIDNLSSQTRLNISKQVTEQVLRNQLNAAIHKAYADARYTNANAYWQEARNKLAKQFTQADFALLQNNVVKALRDGRASQLSNIINKWFADRAQNGQVPYPVNSPAALIDIGADYTSQIINWIFGIEGVHTYGE